MTPGVNAYNFNIMPLDSTGISAIVDVIGAAFGEPRTLEWYRWKHLDGPWGPSRGVIASDGDGIIGVRLLLPWGLRHGGKETIVYRAVEAATVPRARRRGVFQALTESVMKDVAKLEKWSAIFSTPNERSREGHRKLGWTWLPPIHHAYRPVLPSVGGAPSIVSDDVIDSYRDAAAEASHMLATAWTPQALRWRLNARTGLEYMTASLRRADEANGVAYRMASHRRVRVLLPLLTWGRADEQSILVKAVAQRTGALAVLEPTGTGARRALGGPCVRRGESLVSVWSNGREDAWPVTSLDRWSLSMADLESVL